MDPEIQQVLDRIGSEDSPPTNDELLEARNDLADAARAALTPDDGSIPNVAAARDLTEQIKKIDAELATRQEAEAAARAEAAELLEILGDVDGDADGEGEGEGAEGGESAEDGSEGDGEPAADGEGDDDGDEGAPTGESDGDPVEGEPVPVAAGAGNGRVSDPAELSRYLKLGRQRRRGTRRNVTRNDDPPRERYSVDVALSGTAVGRGNQPPRTFREMGVVFDDAAPRVTNGRQTLVTLKKNYPAQRTLAKDIGLNTRNIDDVMSPTAIVAAGGVCDPLPADFDHPVCSERGRPIRDALAQFSATRGGVRYVPSATVGDMIDLGAITEWDYDTDVEPSDQTKACPRVACEDEETAYVDAVVRCLTVGNMQARFSPEFWESRLELLLVAHDRIAELKLFTAMVALATGVTFAAVTGNTVNDTFLAIDRAMAGIQSRHRLMTTRFQFFAPLWYKAALRTSVARQFGRGSDTQALSLADAEINRFFSDRMIDPVWSPDLDQFPAQAAGALEDWPGGTTQTLLMPQGTMMFLDGGTIDLGVEIQDSTLNATNDRQAFAETFEQVALRGCEAYALTLPVDESCVCDGGT